MNAPVPQGERRAVGKLVFSAAALAFLLAWEGFSSTPYVPTQGDVPTIGYGTTRYSDGTKVKMTDPPITRERAAELVQHYLTKDETWLNKLLAGLDIPQRIFDVLIDFSYQFGRSNLVGSSMVRELRAGNLQAACDALLKYKYSSGNDCSAPKNWGKNGNCKGVWTRQQARHAVCTGKMTFEEFLEKHERLQ